MTEIETTITHNGVAYKAELGKVEEATLGFEDHGMLTSYLHLNFGGSGQGFGGLILGGAQGSPATFLLDLWVRSILRITGARDWKQVTGSQVYALREKHFGTIVGIASAMGERVFLASEITDRANPKRDELNVQHAIRRAAEAMERAQQEASTIHYSIKAVADALREARQDINE